MFVFDLLQLTDLLTDALPLYLNYNMNLNFINYFHAGADVVAVLVVANINDIVYLHYIISLSYMIT